MTQKLFQIIRPFLSCHKIPTRSNVSYSMCSFQMKVGLQKSMWKIFFHNLDIALEGLLFQLSESNWNEFSHFTWKEKSGKVIKTKVFRSANKVIKGSNPWKMDFNKDEPAPCPRLLSKESPNYSIQQRTQVFLLGWTHKAEYFHHIQAKHSRNHTGTETYLFNFLILFVCYRKLCIYNMLFSSVGKVYVIGNFFDPGHIKGVSE